jgi:uncharacterized RDD family membrane protein YckC
MTEPAAARPGGFWIRLVAFLLDLLVIGVAQLVLAGVARLRWGAETASAAQGAIGFFTLVFAVAYPAVLHSVAGQTLGKLAFGLRVVAVDGAPLPFGAALLRALAAWFGLVFTLGIGHVIGGLRRDRRALHDLIAGSRVDRLPPAVRRPPLVRRPAPFPPAPAGAEAPVPAPVVPAAPPPIAAPPPAPSEAPRSPFNR